MRRYRGMGYEVVKMKIGGAPLEDDIARIEAVLEVVGEGKYLAVDANGRFDLETAIRYAEAMAPYKLFWYEEAGDPLDYALQAELARHYAGPMATRSEEHTSELQSLMRISYAVFCLKNKKKNQHTYMIVN